MMPSRSWLGRIVVVIAVVVGPLYLLDWTETLVETTQPLSGGDWRLLGLLLAVCVAGYLALGLHYRRVLRRLTRVAGGRRQGFPANPTAPQPNRYLDHLRLRRPVLAECGGCGITHAVRIRHVDCYHYLLCRSCALGHEPAHPPAGGVVVCNPNVAGFFHGYIYRGATASELRAALRGDPGSARLVPAGRPDLSGGRATHDR